MLLAECESVRFYLGKSVTTYQNEIGNVASVTILQSKVWNQSKLYEFNSVSAETSAIDNSAFKMTKSPFYITQVYERLPEIYTNNLIHLINLYRNF